MIKVTIICPFKLQYKLIDPPGSLTMWLHCTDFLQQIFSPRYWHTYQSGKFDPGYRTGPSRRNTCRHAWTLLLFRCSSNLSCSDRKQNCWTWPEISIYFQNLAANCSNTIQVILDVWKLCKLGQLTSVKMVDQYSSWSYDLQSFFGECFI